MGLVPWPSLQAKPASWGHAALVAISLNTEGQHFGKQKIPKSSQHLDIHTFYIILLTLTIFDSIQNSGNKIYSFF